MNKLQIVSFLFAMMTGVVAYQVFSNNPIRNSELHKVIRRHIVKKGECPEGFIKLSLGCVSWDSYNETKADDYDEMTTESQDENTTPHPRQTPGHRRPVYAGTTPPPGPISGLYETPNPQTRSSPGPTKRPRMTPSPTSTSQSSNPLCPTTTSRPVPVAVSRAETTSSPHTMTAAILFVLCVSQLNRAV